MRVDKIRKKGNLTLKKSEVKKIYNDLLQSFEDSKSAGFLEAKEQDHLIAQGALALINQILLSSLEDD